MPKALKGLGAVAEHPTISANPNTDKNLCRNMLPKIEYNHYKKLNDSNGWIHIWIWISSGIPSAATLVQAYQLS